MKKFTILLSITFLTYNLKCQTTQYLDSLAKVHLKNGDTTQYIQTLKKLRFYSHSVEEKNRINNALFDAYWAKKQIKESKYCLDYHRNYFSKDSSSIQRQSMMLFRFFYKEQYWAYAHRMLAIAGDFGFSQRTIDFLKFSINYENFDYDACIGDVNSGKLFLAKKEACLEVLNKLKRRKRNPKLAARLSFIPGMGQFYSGDVKNGLNSIALNGGMIYGGYWLGTNTHPFAALPVILFGSRYYLGGMSNSKIYANKRNIKNRDRFREEIFAKFLTE